MKLPDNGIVVTDATRYYLDGKEVSEEEYRRVFPEPEPGMPMVANAWNRPQLSDALAVHPSQVDEANERNRRRGCSVTYRRDDGRAIVPDRAERRKLLKIERLIDRDGGYGDG